MAWFYVVVPDEREPKGRHKDAGLFGAKLREEQTVDDIVKHARNVFDNSMTTYAIVEYPKHPDYDGAGEHPTRINRIVINGERFEDEIDGSNIAQIPIFHLDHETIVELKTEWNNRKRADIRPRI